MIGQITGNELDPSNMLEETTIEMIQALIDSGMIDPDDVPDDKYIYGLNDTAPPHRKDHIIYAKGYDGLSNLQ